MNMHMQMHLKLIATSAMNTKRGNQVQNQNQNQITKIINRQYTKRTYMYGQLMACKYFSSHCQEYLAQMPIFQLALGEYKTPIFIKRVSLVSRC